MHPSEADQTKHRRLNTKLILLLIILFAAFAYGVQAKFNKISYHEKKSAEIAQLAIDEGYKRCAYKDSLGKKTIGFGHLILPGESFKCIGPDVAVSLLREDYDRAERSVLNRYPWAKGEVKFVLINMTYQLGPNGVAKFKNTLQHLADNQFDAAAVELLNSKWAYQTEDRAARLAARIMALN